MASSDFDPDGLVQAKRLLDELEHAVANFDDVDPRKLLRVLRILADQLEIVRDS
ncbi:hypothetical protein JNB62_05455 [Microbacterium jejuense]|uniref:Uncharacterized protein n=1 Tax=Microbacterium jejuense TaxID=1263637 RepID=A0ABS7HJJ6_9MICO|nr:hypothetical protein [Microbacterium jejuense]MBW9093122.1 hypothetical protein [Microbacterium jejuense]